MRALLFLPRLLWTLFVILTPLLGAWVASSLAAYLNGPAWAAALGGALLFPVLPLLWEWRASSKRKRRDEARQANGDKPRKRILTFWDRMTLRTLIINLAFLAGLLATFPQDGFKAIATRGDWMLYGDQSPAARTARGVLFDSASVLQWLYELSHENPYEELAPDQPTPKPKPSERPEQPAPKPDDKSGTPDTTDDETPGAAPQWPLPDTLHPLITKMPPEAETDLSAVAKYIAQHEQDPFMRVKALHDWVADRIAYDAQGLQDGSYVTKQNLPTIWASRKAVCAGYAKLLVEMGKVTGDEIVYLVGDSRDSDGDVGGAGHAWNAAKIKGQWYLIDATWNAGYVNGATFTKKYTTDYLFTPAKIFGQDHLPKEPEWQLRKDPLTLGEFMRQPMMRPAFYAAGLELISPTRSQVQAEQGHIKIKLKNTQRRHMLTQIVAKGSSSSSLRCQSAGQAQEEFDCKLPGSGTYQIRLFAAPKGKSSGMHEMVGQLEVTN